ncbi:MAG: manganese efflux pump MntP family protein [Erythrobacter sp.]
MLAVIVLALGLAMDAVAVALARGAAGAHRMTSALEVGLAFGAAKGLLPLAGWALGLAFAEWIEPFDHWIAFALLGFLGLRMIREALAEDEPGAPLRTRSHYAALALAALATSLDAGAAGLTLPLFAPPVLVSCLVIASMTAMLCAPAYWLGTKVSQRLGSIAEIAGGIALIAIGGHILFDHLTT